MTITDLQDAMQMAGAMYALMSERLGVLDAQYIELRDAIDERMADSKEAEGKTVKERRANAAAADPELQGWRHEFTHVAALRARYERTMDSHEALREMYSRHITAREVEAGLSSRNGR